MRFARFLRHLGAVFALPPLLAGCLGNSGSSGGAPTGVSVTPGDTMFSVSWNQEAGLNYWMFLSQNATLTPINWINLADGRAMQAVNSPTTVCNQVLYSIRGSTYSLLNGGADTFVTLNSRSGTAPGGPGSPIVAGSARASGGIWNSSAPVPAQVRGLGYAALTGCGAFGRPPAGRFVAIGEGGGMYFSSWSPFLAGQPADPIAALSWSSVAPPPGFSGVLNAVATRVAGITVAGTAAIRYAAVGDAGAILTSVDGAGLVWSVSGAGATSANLHAVTTGGSAMFLAVGDAGAIVASPDGVNWSVQGVGVSQSALRAVHCSGSACIAVGDGGVLVTTANGGSSWVQTISPGANNWRAVAYGNSNLNADYASVAAGSVAINTWVVADDQGNVLYSATGGASWSAATIPGAGPIVGLDYTNRFLALDASGNAFASEDGHNWSAAIQTGIPNPVALVGTGSGFLVTDGTGSTAISF
jgi:hypothetical protein